MMVFSDGAVTVRARQVSLLVETQSILEACLRDKSTSLEIRAEYLRSASHLLGKIVGFVDVEDMLGVIFSEFCVGK